MAGAAGVTETAAGAGKSAGRRPRAAGASFLEQHARRASSASAARESRVLSAASASRPRSWLCTRASSRELVSSRCFSSSSCALSVPVSTSARRPPRRSRTRRDRARVSRLPRARRSESERPVEPSRYGTVASPRKKSQISRGFTPPDAGASMRAWTRSALSFWLSALLTGLAFGYVIQRGGFCLTRAISNLALMGDAGIVRAYVLAILVAVVGVHVAQRPRTGGSAGPALPLARQHPGRAPLRRGHDPRGRLLGQHVVPRR